MDDLNRCKQPVKLSQYGALAEQRVFHGQDEITERQAWREVSTR